MKHKTHAHAADAKIKHLTCENVRLKAEVTKLQEELKTLKIQMMLGKRAMLKKKLRDCTYGEIISICRKQKAGDGKTPCDECPINYPMYLEHMNMYGSICDVSPLILAACAKESLDVEIDIPEEEIK